MVKDSLEMLAQHLSVKLINKLERCNHLKIGDSFVIPKKNGFVFSRVINADPPCFKSSKNQPGTGMHDRKSL